MNTKIGPDDIYEIYEYYFQPFWQSTWFKIVASVCILLLLLGLILFILVWRRKRKQTPWESALDEISKLSVDKCQSKDDFKKFYFSLTWIIKKYLHKRFGWAILDKTDDELIIFLQNKGFDVILQDSLKTMFRGAVWIKFANEGVLKTQAESDLLVAKVMIEKTRPVDQK
jgi:hypothetical protein